MARMRVIKPEFWSDEKLGQISILARLVFIGLWNLSDDYGVVKGSVIWIKGQLFPYDEVDVDSTKVRRAIDELESADRIRQFDHNGEVFYFIPKFLDHQKIDKVSKTRNPQVPKEIQKARRIIVDESSNGRRPDSDINGSGIGIGSGIGSGINSPATPEDFKERDEQWRKEGIKLGQIALARRYKGGGEDAMRLTAMIWNQYKPYNITPKMFEWIVSAKIIPNCNDVQHCLAYSRKIGDVKGEHVSEARRFISVED